MSATREWITAAAASMSAIFTGLIWSMAARRFRSRFDLRPLNVTAEGYIEVSVSIHNRSNSDLYIEYVEADPPVSILVSDSGSAQTYNANVKHLTSQRVPYDWRIKPDEFPTRHLVLSGGVSAESRKRISIRVYISRRFFAMRHRKKVLRAILPESMRRGQS